MQSNIKVVTENFRAIGHAAIQMGSQKLQEKIARGNLLLEKDFCHNKKHC